MIPEARLMEALRVAWPILLGEDGWDFIPNHCILAARTAIEVGHYFGHDWESMPVDIMFVNKAGFKEMEAGVPISEWPSGAWSVGCRCDAEDEPGRFSGHLIVASRRLLLDLSAGQFDRPHKALSVEPWVATRQDESGPWVFVDENETRSIITPRPEHTRYREAPDWKKNYRPLAAELIRRLKEAA